MNVFILFVVLSMGSGGSPYRSVTFQQEFNSKQTCEMAAESIRNRIQNGRVELATCEKQ